MSFSIGTGSPDGFDRIGGGSGFGVGLKVNGGQLAAYGWSSNAKREDIANVDDGLILAVGKITWAASGSYDLIEIFLPGTDLVLPDTPASSLEFDFDQSVFTTLGFAGGNTGTVPEIDGSDLEPLTRTSSAVRLFLISTLFYHIEEVVAA